MILVVNGAVVVLIHYKIFEQGDNNGDVSHYERTKTKLWEKSEAGDGYGKQVYDKISNYSRKSH